MRAESFESIGRPSACASTRCMSERSGSDHHARAPVFVRRRVSTPQRPADNESIRCLHSVIVARVYYVFGVTRRREARVADHAGGGRWNIQPFSSTIPSTWLPLSGARGRLRVRRAPACSARVSATFKRLLSANNRPRPRALRGKRACDHVPALRAVGQGLDALGMGGSVCGVAASRRRRSDASASAGLAGESRGSRRRAPRARAASTRSDDPALVRVDVRSRARAPCPRTVPRPRFLTRARRVGGVREHRASRGVEAATSRGESRGSGPPGKTRTPSGHRLGVNEKRAHDPHRDRVVRRAHAPAVGDDVGDLRRAIRHAVLRAQREARGCRRRRVCMGDVAGRRARARTARAAGAAAGRPARTPRRASAGTEAGRVICPASSTTTSNAPVSGSGSFLFSVVSQSRRASPRRSRGWFAAA